MLKKILLAGLILVVNLAISNATLADANTKADIANYGERLTIVVSEICQDSGCWLIGIGEDKDGKFLVFLDFEGTFEGEVNPLRDTLKAECGKEDKDRQALTFAVKQRLTVREVLGSGKAYCGCKLEALEALERFGEVFNVKTFYAESYYKINP